MANFTRETDTGTVDIAYDVHDNTGGTGFPLLLLAPGGMRSAASFWLETPWNPSAELSDQYQVVVMDQRNAGSSTAPVTAGDGWASYTSDQLALMDHLGFDRFHVAGMCIGGPFIMGLIQAAPDRVVSGTVFQSIGLDDNRHAFYGMFDDWQADLAPTMASVAEGDWQQYRLNMYDGDNFLFNVAEDFVQGVTTPLLVLLGDDLYHPQSASRKMAALAPNATLVEDWKAGDARTAAMAQCAAFLAEHTPK